MEQFKEVLEHLRSAYIAGAGNTDIGLADGRVSRIGALIVEIGGASELLDAQRRAGVVREQFDPIPEKKTLSERKPAASLMQAGLNPVALNQALRQSIRVMGAVGSDGLMEKEAAVTPKALPLSEAGWLTEVDYKGMSGSAIAGKFSVEQIEATLNYLGINFDPANRAKQKANALLQATK